MKKKIVLCIWFNMVVMVLYANQFISRYSLPQIGAQVFIEPGQSEEETEQWFKIMKDKQMSVCRIRMFECYMRTPKGGWDFSLFDRAFRLAEKYGIRVMGTFFPMTEKTDIGGWKFPKNEQQLHDFATYIKAVTKHFKSFSSLYAWVLINEPGDGFGDGNTEFIREMRMKWMSEHHLPDISSDGYSVLANLQEKEFECYLTTFMLRWIAREVRKYDAQIPLHVNNHNIFNNLPEYNFPQWRTFLTTLGGSAHASWHFSLFQRKEYSLAMSANSEILLSGAGDLPWLMTELQGGNNTYSGNRPMCPTQEEITQWLWTVIGTGGKGAIFWSLNGRSAGIEAGEWALLDYQHQPTARLHAVASVVECLKKYEEHFRIAHKYASNIHLIYIREALWGESVIAPVGRECIMKNVLGYFKAFSEKGISPTICAMDEFDFSKDDYSRECIVLAHQIVIPHQYINQLENFVIKGGTLIVDGLTGYYDDYLQCRPLIGFKLSSLLGGQIKEWVHQESPFSLLLGRHSLTACGWKGYIQPNKESRVICGENSEPLAIAHTYGMGKVFWMPSLIGIAAKEDGRPLVSWLEEIGLSSLQNCSFQNYESDVMMKVLQTENGLIHILINKSAEQRSVKLHFPKEVSNFEIWFANKGGNMDGQTVNIYPEETVVLFSEL